MVRGIEIHNGEVVFPEGMPQTLHLGTTASPLTQGEAGQIVISAVINAIALGGIVIAGFFRAEATVNLTGDIYGLNSVASVDDGITVTGGVYGAYVQSFIGDGSVITPGEWNGLRVNMYGHTGALSVYAYGIHINNFIQFTPSGEYYFMRMCDNGGSTLTGAFHVSADPGDVENLFVLRLVKTAWDDTTQPPGAAVGRIAVLVNGTQLYIPLWN